MPAPVHVPEIMLPLDAARWFRRSASWLRRQPHLIRLSPNSAQPLYHVEVCRAYFLGRLLNLPPDELHRVQLAALAAACGIDVRTLRLAASAPSEAA